MAQASRQGLVFAATRDAFDQIERAHDLFWSAAVSMWNTRAHVVGLRTMAPTMDQATLAARMAAGSGLQGSNVVTATVRFTWDDELSEIALLRLIQLLAHYEGWLEAVGSEILPAAKRRSWCRAMTFHSQFASALTSLGSSNAMIDLYTAAKGHPYCVDHVIAEVVTCIRYFKEVRNCAIHSGRRADTNLLMAQADYEATILSGVLAGVYRPPKPNLVAATGDIVSVGHYAIIGLTGLVQRALATLDGMISRTAAGEEYYLAQWKLAHQKRALPADPTKRWEKVRRGAGKIGPRPNTPVPSLEALLKAHGLIVF